MSDKKYNLELEERSEKPLTYNPPGMSGEWQFNDASFASSSMGIVPSGNSMVVGGDGVGPSCSSGAMMDSFGSAVWENPVDTVSLGFNEMNVHSVVSASDPLSMLKGSMFIPSMSGLHDLHPDSLSQFPADSAFIERAARFSSFSGGHFDELLNPFCMQQSVNPYICGGTVIQGSQELLSGNSMKMLPTRQSQSSDANVPQTSKDVSLPLGHRVVDISSPINEAMARRSHGEAVQGVSVSGNGSDEPQYSGGGTREDSNPSSAKGLGAKKRKRNNRDAESEEANAVQQQSGEAGEKISEIQQMEEQNLAAAINKSNGKQSSQNSDPPKDDYIHVRARRGQATNSHSLAERVRREKISERMKYLQDLVPGCSKVTGKAVMLDEIINYVQSLQRQVEFLSMKLATVNPRLDFNIEQLLAKEHMLPARSGPSGIGISPSMSMVYPPLHPSQPLLLQPGHLGIENCSDLLRRTISSQLTNIGGGYKEPTHQATNPWEDELHNIVQMGGFNATDPVDNQETNCSGAQGPMKAEP